MSVEFSWQDFSLSVKDFSYLLCCFQKELLYPNLQSCCIPKCFGNKMCSWRIPALWILGSFCSLAQQSLLCIKHLRTAVLNKIFIFPVDTSSLFWGQQFGAYFLCQILIHFPLRKSQGCSLPTAGNRTCIVMSGSLPLGTFLFGPSWLQGVTLVIVGWLGT